MSPQVAKLIATVAVIVVSMIAGYVARRLRWAPQKLAEICMVLVVVAGYTPVGFLSIWGLGRVEGRYAWLPVLGGVHWILMAAAGLAVGRAMFRDRPSVGMMGLAGGAGNTGFTMGGFVIYVLLGTRGLGLVSIFCLMWTPMMVLLLYPVGRFFSPRERPAPLGRLVLRSLFDWRSIGLPFAILGLTLASLGVPRPNFVARFRLVDVLMYGVTAIAYFAIGLRLHASHVLGAWKALSALAGLRFLLAPLVGLGLAWATHLTPWPMGPFARKVLLIECCVPTAVTMVAVCNMFDLRPEKASVLFIVNTLMYLALVLPFVAWLA